MCSGSAHPTLSFCYYAKHLGSLLYCEAAILEQAPLPVVGRYCGGVHNECRFGVLAFCGDKVNILLKVKDCTLFNESVCEFAWCAVISAHKFSFVEEVSYERAHANAAGSQKIYRFDILKLHLSL